MEQILTIDEMMRIRDTFTCDGLFLIFDTAKHNNFSVSIEDVRDHINECEDCQDDNAVPARVGS